MPMNGRMPLTHHTVGAPTCILQPIVLIVSLVNASIGLA